MEGTVLGYSKAVEAAAKNLKPHSEESVTIQVAFSPKKGIFAEYLDAEYNAIRYAYEASGSRLPEWFSEEHFQKYCNSALVSRIAWVRNEMAKVIFRPEERVLVPSLLDNILKNIGQAVDTSLGIVLMPTLAGEREGGNSSPVEVLTKDEVLKTSMFLSTIDNFIGGQGYLKDRSGSWDFMTMQCLEDSVMNISDHPHPAYSILASVVAPAWLKSAVEFSPRVKYGDLEFYKGIIWQLTSIG